MGLKNTFKNMVGSLVKKRGYSLITTAELDRLKNVSEYNVYIENQKYLERSEYKYVLWLDRIYQKIATVPGHIVELGVAYGRNSIILAHQIQMNGDELTRKYYGFDTFSGYNEESLRTDKHLSAQSWKDNSKKWVQDKINRVGVGHVCELIEGDILVELPKFLEKNPNFRAALLYVDCNAYLPSFKGMEALKEFMSPGGIICIDEKRQGGETKALIEFCKKNDLIYQKDASPFAIPAFTVVK
jgi:predicted O-methyltransferase YrrM